MAGVMDDDDMFVSWRSMFVPLCWGAGLLHPVGQEIVLAATGIHCIILPPIGGILQSIGVGDMDLDLDGYVSVGCLFPVADCC